MTDTESHPRGSEKTKQDKCKKKTKKNTKNYTLAYHFQTAEIQKQK